MDTQEQKPKRKIFKKIGMFLKPILRGVLKSIPILNPIIEISENIKADIKTAKGEETPVKTRHNYLSIIIQIICLGVVIYAFATKQITVEDVLKILNFSTDAPSETITN